MDNDIEESDFEFLTYKYKHVSKNKFSNPTVISTK